MFVPSVVHIWVLHVHYEYLEITMCISLCKIRVKESRAPSCLTFDVAYGHQVNDIGKLHATSTKLSCTH